MKKLYLIGGTMGVGKTTVCNRLKTILPNCVFLDGDWCWNASPFTVNDETKEMVVDNICYLLNNFLHCSAYDNVVFCWVMHEQAIIDNIINRLDTSDCKIAAISLTASENTLRARLASDIASGIRTADVVENSVARLPLYDKLNTIKIHTDNKTVDDVAKEIKAVE